jgi:hypothetical protein
MSAACTGLSHPVKGERSSAPAGRPLTGRIRPVIALPAPSATRQGVKDQFRHHPRVRVSDARRCSLSHMNDSRLAKEQFTRVDGWPTALIAVCNPPRSLPLAEGAPDFRHVTKSKAGAPELRQVK